METIGRYEVVRALGQGAMGRVFLARDPDLERMVALKLLHEHAAQADAQLRFRDEAKALAALNHPGIVGIYEIGVHEMQDFIAMEYLPGRSLREVLQAADRVAQRDELLAICAKVAVAVAAAHRAGILHRDIKPENVVVTDRGDVKVVDFGIARRMRARAETRQPVRRLATPIEQVEDVIDVFMATMPVTQTDRDTLATEATPLSAGVQTVFGTPGYMAPEVLTGSDSSEASDVYSLGVLVYECLAGRRPYDAPSLAEVMAMVIDGSEPPEPLADRHWPLIARMLAREPTDRPQLDEVAATLAPPVPPRSRRWPVVVAAAGALAVGAVVTWRLARNPAAEAVPIASVAIVVEPIENAIPSYGAMPPTKRAISDVLAALLRTTSGLHVTSVGAAELIHELGLPAPTAGKEPDLTAADMTTVETRLGAYVVRGSIEPHDSILHGHLVLSRPDGTATAIDRDRPIAELAKLMDDLAGDVATAIDRHATIARSDKNLARSFANAGATKLADAEFYDARPLLEQAIDLDPGSFEAWYALASVRSWMQAPEPDVKDAIAHALALAQPGVQKQLLEGVALALDESYRKALAKLAPLETNARLTNTESRDLLYYLGEAHYHLGHQAIGVAYFRRALERDPKFKPAMIHPLYFALGRRDAVGAGEIGALMNSVDHATIEFALGHYTELADHPGQMQLFAQLVLHRTPSPELVAELGFYDRSILAIAEAMEAGDTGAERRELATLWKAVRGSHPEGDATYYMLVQFGEVLLAGERPEPLRELLAYFAEIGKTKPVIGRWRLMILAAPLLHEHVELDRSVLTDRELALDEASEAELTGNHARAAELLQGLVDDPTQLWNFPERVALLRNLSALHRTKEIAAVCKELSSPALFHYSQLPARMHCR